MNTKHFCKLAFFILSCFVLFSLTVLAQSDKADDSMKDCPYMGTGHTMENCPMKKDATAEGTAKPASTSHNNDKKSAGMQTRRIKALSQEQIEQLRAGEGMGTAMPAELNHYPGPRHLLDFADKIKLTGQQKQILKASYEDMHKHAVELGEKIIAKETELDELFASKAITRESLTSLVNEIASLQGELRITHLQAHLGTKNLLSPEQVKKYDALRGYGDAKPAKGETSHKM